MIFYVVDGCLFWCVHPFFLYIFHFIVWVLKKLSLLTLESTRLTFKFKQFLTGSLGSVFFYHSVSVRSLPPSGLMEPFSHSFVQSLRLISILYPPFLPTFLFNQGDKHFVEVKMWLLKHRLRPYLPPKWVYKTSILNVLLSTWGFKIKLSFMILPN